MMERKPVEDGTTEVPPFPKTIGLREVNFPCSEKVGEQGGETATLAK
jgi:hypothetical protein